MSAKLSGRGSPVKSSQEAPPPFSDAEIASAYFDRDDIAFTWICIKCGKKVRQTGVGHKALCAHVKFIHTNYDAELRSVFADTNSNGKVSSKEFISEKIKFNLHAHRVTVEDLSRELDIDPDRIDETKTIDGVHDWTPLNFACHNWNWDAALHLLLRGADPNIVNSRGISPLMCAANGGNISVMSQLVGAIIDAVDEKGQTALIRACKNNHIDAAEYLVRGGAALDVQDVNGNDAMSYLVFEEHRQRLRTAFDSSSRRHRLSRGIW